MLGGEILAGQSPSNQRHGFGNSIECDKRTHARSLFLAEQYFVECLEPVAEIFKAMAFADFIDFTLNVCGGGVFRQCFED